MTEDRYIEATQGNEGYCRHCKDFTTDFAEPDARNYECAKCGQLEVFGAEESLLMGLITISPDCSTPE